MYNYRTIAWKGLDKSILYYYIYVYYSILRLRIRQRDFDRKMTVVHNDILC